MTEENIVEDKSLRALVEKTSEKLDTLIADKTAKKWKLPWGSTPSKGQVSKGWAIFQVIRENGEIQFIKAPISDLTAKIDGFPRIATPDYKLTYKGLPMYIIPSWSMKPFSPVDNYAEVEKDKMHIAGRRIILASMETEQIKPKKSMGGMLWILLIIGACAIGWYLFKGGF